MFKALTYPVKVNAALVALGINPQDIRPLLRQAAQAFGLDQGYTPQEASLLIASKLPVALIDPSGIGTVRGWIRERKINPLDINIRDALVDIGWEGFVPGAVSADPPVQPPAPSPDWVQSQKDRLMGAALVSPSMRMDICMGIIRELHAAGGSPLVEQVLADPDVKELLNLSCQERPMSA